MKSKRAFIKDLNRPEPWTVTEMLITDIDNTGENMLMFSHPDGGMTIINMMPGWALTVSGEEVE